MQKRVVASCVLLSLVTALFTFGLTGGVASAASTGHVRAAAIGGCAEHYGGLNNSFEIGVCISDRNTGSVIYPDAYVNQQLLLPPYNCSLYVELWEGNFKWSQAGPFSCALGHYDGIPFGIAGAGCLPLHSSVWLSLNGSFYRIGDSPTYTYCA